MISKQLIDEDALRKQAVIDGVTHFTTGVAVVHDDTILVVRRVAHDDTLAGEWELPGGGVDPEETIEQGAIRELLEETGLRVDKVLGTFKGFDYTTPKKPKARQINFTVSVAPDNIQLAEHDAYRWITEDEISELKTNQVMQDCLHRAFQTKS